MRLLLFYMLLFSFVAVAQKQKTAINNIDITLKTDSIQNIHIKDTIYTKSHIDVGTLSIKDIIPIKKDDDTWLKTYLPSIIALFVLFVTNIVVLIKIKIESKEVLKRDFTLSSIKLDKERLEYFYDPIFTTLSTNEDIFKNFGPKSFPDDDDLRNEASIVWNSMVEKIIIPNNKLISDTITSKSHLISKTDNLDQYLTFLKHAQSYAHFIEHPNSIHNKYKYDIDFISTVKARRDEIVYNLNELEKTLHQYGSKKRS